jgi:hypothetical protein
VEVASGHGALPPSGAGYIQHERAAQLFLPATHRPPLQVSRYLVRLGRLPPAPAGLIRLYEARPQGYSSGTWRAEGNVMRAIDRFTPLPGEKQAPLVDPAPDQQAAIVPPMGFGLD